jgi:hypothetical protein
MTNLRLLLFLVASASTLAAHAGERCSATGPNTLRCGRELVRVDGLDAKGGKPARDRLQRRLQAGEVVVQRRGRDKHGYTLGRLYVDGNRISQVDVAPRR